jgi:isopentenyl phosphate kinase
METLVFLKLGGSLITDKDRPHTARLEVLERLAEEVAQAREAQAREAKAREAQAREAQAREAQAREADARGALPGLRLVLGHGSGSFGHTAARKYGTRLGVHTHQDWAGFAEVWKEARALNQIVIDALAAAGIPVIAFPPSASVIAQDGQVLRWDLSPLQAALSAGLVPLVNGDTIFDEQRGGTILSTEDLFIYLARHLHPTRILLAGRETGVWEDFPTCTRLIESITPQNFSVLVERIGGSASVDVTGGMLEKVRTMLELAEELPGFEAQIFSGLEAGNVRKALAGEVFGTAIRK